MNFSRAQQIIMDCRIREYVMPRGRGATTACVEGAIKFIDNKSNVNVLVGGTSLVGFESILAKRDMKLGNSDSQYTLHRDFVNEYDTITNIKTNSTINFVKFGNGKSIIQVDKLYDRVFIDNIDLTEDEILTLPCITSGDYCTVKSDSGKNVKITKVVAEKESN